MSAIAAAHEIKKVFGLTVIHGVALGSGASVAAKDAGSLIGEGKILVDENDAFSKYTASVFAVGVKKAFEQVSATILVAASTSTSKDFIPQVAAHLGAGQASDILAVLPDKGFKRAMYAGNAIAEVELLSDKKVITVRPTAFTPGNHLPGASAIEVVSLFDSASVRENVVSYDIAKGGRPELGDATVVVSGGRALGSSDNFQKIMYPLADEFGAAVGASRAAVDSGYAPNDWQVGQTGKIVAPQLYIAVGISGAIQHLAGMKDSKVIVAINKDPDAPIFEIADYGLVADLFAAVPELIKEVKAAKA
jgi:electron transfer flavoprotein alpha subunit